MMREVRESASYSIPRAKGELAVQLTVASGNRVFGNPVPREGEARTKRRPSSAQLYGLGGACDLHKRINDRSRLGGPNQACDLFARLEKDQRRPELHAIRASERRPEPSSILMCGTDGKRSKAAAMCGNARWQ